MGTGKSTIGRQIAKEMGHSYVDTDALMESRTGRSIKEIFDTNGEEFFRKIECEVLKSVLSAQTPAVISTGGGIIVTDTGRELLLGARAHGASVVWLQATVETMLERLARSTHRPLLGGGDKGQTRSQVLGNLLKSRMPLYEEVATHKIPTDALPIQRILREVMNALAAPAASDLGIFRVHVSLGERSYDVLVGNGARSLVGTLLPSSAKRCVVVTQKGITPLVDLPIPSTTIFISAGEENKTLNTVEILCRQFAQYGLTRNDVIVAVGGGLITDIAGYAAASYHRGTAVVHVATTLLAMVDAAIGGKTGVNLPEGKNLVGAFWQPVGVVCDTSYLATLPERELRCGWGEVAKYHFLTGDDLLSLSGDARIARCVEIKAKIVAEDEREGAKRALLNYGHTFGHAIETSTNHRFAHGEAVALGLLCAAYLARHLGRIGDARVQEHRDVLKAYGLTAQLPNDVTHDELIALMARDKKAIDGLTFILDGVKGLEVVTNVAPSDVREALKTMAADQTSEVR